MKLRRSQCTRAYLGLGLASLSYSFFFSSSPIRATIQTQRCEPADDLPHSASAVAHPYSLELLSPSLESATVDLHFFLIHLLFANELRSRRSFRAVLEKRVSRFCTRFCFSTCVRGSKLSAVFASLHPSGRLSLGLVGARCAVGKNRRMRPMQLLALVESSRRALARFAGLDKRCLEMSLDRLADPTEVWPVLESCGQCRVGTPRQARVRNGNAPSGIPKQNSPHSENFALRPA